MRVLSGIQPSGDFLHLGNYFGAIRQQIELALEHEALLFIAEQRVEQDVRVVRVGNCLSPCRALRPVYARAVDVVRRFGVGQPHDPVR